MKAVVLIPTFNGERFLAACLKSLFNQQYADFHVIVVDNGSTDGSVELITRDFPQVRVFQNVTNLGFSRAVNQGIRASLSDSEVPDVVVVLNQDTELAPGWLEQLIEPLRLDKRIGVVGSLARFPDGRIQHAGGRVLRPLGYGRNIATGATTIPEELAEPDYMAAMATAFRTGMLQAIGLFDEEFSPAYFEDVDLCMRATAAGWKLHLARGAEIVHYEGAASRDDYQYTALIERNRLRFVLKHFSPEELLGPFLVAERDQLRNRPLGRGRQVLKQAYLHALLALPSIAVTRGFSPTTQAALAQMLADLRTDTPVEQQERDKRTQLREPAAPRVTFSVGKCPPVSIIMLTWNGLSYTQACLESLFEKTRGVDFHLVVVDNGSTDGTREWLRQQSNITLIENDENLGFVRGNNQAMRIVPPEHDIVLLNNDMLIVQDDWLARLRDVANSNSEYGVVGCTLLRPDGTLQHAGTYMPTSNFWGYQIGGGETYMGQYPGIREVQGVVGACMYIRRDVRTTVGELDTDFFSYYEDTDYCLRAIQAGYKVICVGDVHLLHYENTSTKVNSVNWSKMFSAAQATFLRKWRRALEERFTRRLVWQSLVAAPTGYGTSSREFVVELDRRDVDIRLIHVFGTDYTEPSTGDPRIEQLRIRPKDTSLTQVVYSQGDAFIKNSGRYRVGFTMLEADGLPRDWVDQANQMDEVWVPTTWGAETFAASGVRRPIHVIPLGVNPNYFHPNIARRRPARNFVFLSVFEWLERKAPEALLRAYIDEFKPSDDVVLILKTFSKSGNIRQRVHELARGRPTPSIVLLEDQSIPAYQMGSIYRSADCFVLPTRGEGWGMPILEAMACGLPVIATDWGAQRDFFHAEVGYPIRIHGLVPAVTQSPYYAGLRWADPDIEHLRELMRYVYEHPAEARAVGERAAHAAATQWTWSCAVDRVLERLDEIEG